MIRYLNEVRMEVKNSLDTGEANGIDEGACETSSTAEELEDGDTSTSFEVREQLHEVCVA